MSAVLTIFVVTRDEVGGLAKAKLASGWRFKPCTKRYLRKLRAYWLLWKTCGHQRKFNIPRFRVLTLTTSGKRKENLRTLARQADDGKRGSPMFLFACEKSFHPEQPITIFNPIWQTPINNSCFSLIS